MSSTLADKLRGGRPVEISEEEAGMLREALRGAMATALEISREEIADEALVFDELGLDSIDVFDVLDQLAGEFDLALEPEDLPPDLIFGKEGLRFDQFVQSLLTHLRSAPEEPAPEESAP
jgi:acyl carrier protein